MPTDWEHGLHDLVASIRAVGTALADPTSGLPLNMELGITTYAASPVVAVGVVAAMAEQRLRLLDEALGRNEQASTFPRERLLAGLREVLRLLVPGGRLVIGFRPAEHGRPRRLDPEVYRIPTTAQLVEVLGSAGFVAPVLHEAGASTIVVAATPSASE